MSKNKLVVYLVWEQQNGEDHNQDFLISIFLDEEKAYRERDELRKVDSPYWYWVEEKRVIV